MAKAKSSLSAQSQKKMDIGDVTPRRHQPQEFSVCRAENLAAGNRSISERAHGLDQRKIHCHRTDKTKKG
ncbi:hypothetical protein [Collimonas silvisoli]|uniref:hypothetical protein n=1 Tax=Collimonas silvisoli TaxID=2825884 RepID=UPI001B8B2CB5|nr:hypothetical protein [Collimonas silvisoli]